MSTTLYIFQWRVLEPQVVLITIFGCAQWSVRFVRAFILSTTFLCENHEFCCVFKIIYLEGSSAYLRM